MNARRRAVTLGELVVALACGAILATAAASVLRGTVAGAARRERTRLGAATADEALAVAVRLIEDALAVVVLADSAILLESSVADVVPCADGTAGVIGGPPSTPPGADDVWRAMRHAPSSDPPSWERTAARPLRADGTLCSVPDSTWLMMRVTRRQRLGVYRATDGSWTLGLRRCGSLGCDPPQPLAAPLAAPTAGGWRVSETPCAVAVVVRGLFAVAPRSALARRC